MTVYIVVMADDFEVKIGNVFQNYADAQAWIQAYDETDEAYEWNGIWVEEREVQI